VKTRQIQITSGTEENIVVGGFKPGAGSGSESFVPGGDAERPQTADKVQ